MTISCAIYNGVPCSDALFAEMQASYLSDGYISGYEDELEVTVTNPVAMKIQVSTGRARIRGRWYRVKDNPYELAISAAHTTLSRIDRIVLRLEAGAPKQISARVLPGTAAASPSAPALTQTSSTYEISLAQVLVAAGVSTIEASAITSERDDYSVCGIAGVRPFRFSEVTISANLALGGYKAVNVATPTASTDAANLTYFNTKLISGVFGENKCPIIPWISDTIPTGYLECNGQSVLRASYPVLFGQIGTTFGSVDGTHFNLPDLSSRTGLGSTSSLGTTGGEATHKLLSTEIPSHAHPKCGSIPIYSGGSDTPLGGISATTGNTASAGGDGTHNNLQPYVVFRYIVYGS